MTREMQRSAPFTFIDLFAGIGGFRIGLEDAGGQCLFSSEWDKFAQLTYEANFGERPRGDIREIESSQIPPHDVLAAGFPCQPFSLAGVSKKNSLGRKHGFDCDSQGNLFFEIVRIADALETPVLFLENVKNLRSHDGGNTWRVIHSTLEEAGYVVSWAVVDAQACVPQHRERVYIVALRRSHFSDVDFSFEMPKRSRPRLADILEPNPDPKYTLSDGLWSYLQAYKEKHRAAGNGFGYGLVDPRVDPVTRTLSARYHKDGSEILIQQAAGNPRRLTPRECARLMGYPDSFQIVVSDTQAYRQFGNSVAVPVVRTLANRLAATIRTRDESAATERTVISA